MEKNFKAKKLLKYKLIGVILKWECCICEEEKECVYIQVSNDNSIPVCLDCLQYQGNKKEIKNLHKNNKFLAELNDALMLNNNKLNKELEDLKTINHWLLEQIKKGVK